MGVQADTWVHDLGKFKMVLSKTDVDISPQIEKFGWYEDEKFDTKVFEKHLKKEMTVLDLGANIGFYSLFARSIVGKRGRVFSFEPFPGNIALLRESIRQNGFTNVFAIESAVSDKTGTAILYLSPDACSEHSLLDLDFDYAEQDTEKQIQVAVTSVDDYFAKNHLDAKIDFIKMDIEASESRALRGMQKTLDQNQKISIMTEFWPNGFREDEAAPEDFLYRLVGLGFDLYHIDAYYHKLQQRTPDEIMNLEKTSQDLIAQNKVMQEAGWYTNLLCIRQ
jgi:FkbM family methyltransferase